jgi:anti-anti-sigma regulatory factor
MRIVTITLDCASMREADGATIDLIAQVKLASRRNGTELRLENVSPELVELMGLCGLAVALGVEVRREPEQRKEPRGVQEEGELGDSPV